MHLSTKDLLSRPRTDCQVRDADCEGFTRCVKVAFFGGAVDACPTCASEGEVITVGE